MQRLRPPRAPFRRHGGVRQSRARSAARRRSWTTSSIASRAESSPRSIGTPRSFAARSQAARPREADETLCRVGPSLAWADLRAGTHVTVGASIAEVKFRSRRARCVAAVNWEEAMTARCGQPGVVAELDGDLPRSCGSATKETRHGHAPTDRGSEAAEANARKARHFALHAERPAATAQARGGSGLAGVWLRKFHVAVLDTGAVDVVEEVRDSRASPRRRSCSGEPLSTRAPLGVAFATCFVKGSASDAVSQQVVEQRPALDVQRNTAFAFFSGAYLGCGQHFVYNVAFTRVFGSGRSAGVALCKVLADAIVHVPCVYLPLYYAFETPALGKGSPYDGLVRYREDAYDVLTTYWSTWPAVHFVSFTMLPPRCARRRPRATPRVERYRSAPLRIASSVSRSSRARAFCGSSTCRSRVTNASRRR